MNRKLDIEKVKRIPALIEEGRSYEFIAQELGVTTRTVGYWVRRLKDAGVKMKITMGPKALKL